MITVLHRGGYAQMITILHRGGGGSLGTPKSDYVICARPLIMKTMYQKDTKNVQKQNVSLKFCIFLIFVKTFFMIRLNFYFKFLEIGDEEDWYN